MRYYRIEIAADGLFPMDGTNEDDVIMGISNNLEQIGLNVLDSWVKIVRKQKGESDSECLARTGNKEIQEGPFIILNWWNSSDINVILGEELGKPKLFVTKEEAEEYCNTKLDGFYKVVNLGN